MTETGQPGTPFWHQPAPERTLKQAARLGRIPRSLLLAGPTGTGKWAAAIWVAQSLLCRQTQEGAPCRSCRDCQRVYSASHPDLHLLFPVPSKSAVESEAEFLKAKSADPFTVVRFDNRPYITLERIRGLIAELNKTAVEGGAKVVILDSVEQTANEDCQSVLLKTIEEPPPDAYFILTSAAPERLLPTILSRCQTIRFVPVDQESIAARLIREQISDQPDAEMVARLSGGGWGNALRLASEGQRAWRDLAIEFWNGAFRSGSSQVLAQVDSSFPTGRGKVGFEVALQAFDVWALCLLRDCQQLTSSGRQGQVGAPIPDLETGWACWRILQNGRSTLYVNVADRHAISGTFVALRRRLNCLNEPHSTSSRRPV